jgi:site-specific DNA-methyltransferase (adenine-specific)
MLEKRPLICFTDTDKKLVVLGGNMRLKAAKEVGLKELPVILADDWTEEQKTQFLIKDNVGFGEWNWDELKSDWDVEKLEEWGLDLPDFKSEELEAEEDDYEIPDAGIETDIVPGDLFEIGPHRLLCGDSTDSEQVAKLMNGQKADMVFTDPPYGVDYKGINNDDRKGLEDLLNSAFENYLLNVKNGASIYCFHSDRCADIFHKIFREFCHFSSMIIWEKESIVLSQTDYQSKHEPCLYGWFNNGTHKWYSDRKQESIWIAKSKREEGHTTPKPIEIISKALNNSSLINHIILDLFLGSGSTMVASHQLKRKCYGMELDPKYCQVILDRMRKLDPSLKIKKNGHAI